MNFVIFYFVFVIFLKHKFDGVLVSFDNESSIAEIMSPMSYGFNNGTGFLFNGGMSLSVAFSILEKKATGRLC